ncbi:unnamed protein product [Rhizophagus irregularis]|nr:unnamed protein product [Rhizophagus irregularis]
MIVFSKFFDISKVIVEHYIRASYKILVIRTYLCFINTHDLNLHINESPNPFFEYHKCLREFELYPFQEGLREFIRHVIKLKTINNLTKKINKIIKPLNRRLGDLLLNKVNNNLNHLNIKYDDMSGLENQLNLCSLNDIDDVLLNITRLSLEFLIVEDSLELLLDMITRKKRNLHHLSISNNNHIKFHAALIKLLESQQCLKTLEIPALWTSENLSSFLNIFHKISHSLISLKISNSIKCVTLFSLIDILHNLRKFESLSLHFHNDDDFLNSPIPSSKSYKLEVLIFTEPVLLHPHIANYRLVFERIKAMSNIIVPEIYSRHNR